MPDLYTTPRITTESYWSCSACGANAQSIRQSIHDRVRASGGDRVLCDACLATRQPAPGPS